MFLDDSAFVFESRNDLIKGLSIIKYVFGCFGLEMHLGKGEVKSKTECIYFPKPSFFKPPEALQPECLSNDTVVEKDQKSLSFKQMDEIYDKADKTARIMLDNDYLVDFTKHFKYLGSYISYHFRDDYDIKMRLTQENSTMGALKHFWNNP